MNNIVTDLKGATYEAALWYHTVTKIAVMWSCDDFQSWYLLSAQSTVSSADDKRPYGFYNGGMGLHSMTTLLKLGP